MSKHKPLKAKLYIPDNEDGREAKRLLDEEPMWLAYGDYCEEHDHGILLVAGDSLTGEPEMSLEERTDRARCIMRLAAKACAHTLGIGILMPEGVSFDQVVQTVVDQIKTQLRAREN